LGAYDQTSPAYAPDHRGLRERFAEDADFVAAVEAHLPPGATVMQLPYVPFPEQPPVWAMHDYDHLRAYLHSRSLRWSYGAARGREGDLWQQSVTERPVEDLVRTLALAGFGGVYVNRDGFADGGRALTEDLDHLLGPEPIRSRSGRLCLYDLTGYARQLRSDLGEERWAAAHEAALHPVLFGWGTGFHALETVSGEHWRWCAATGELNVYNPGDRPKSVTLSMGLRSATGASARLSINGPGLAEMMTIGADSTLLTRTVTVPPGRHRILFATDAPRLLFPGDTRLLHFRVENFSTREADEPDSWAAR
jgi:phosphoglycerol transferase